MSPNRVTFPPPERGFMIRYGRRGGATSCSVGRSGIASPASAARPAATATTTSPTATSTTHNSPRPTYSTSTSNGAATATAAASQRTRPLLASAHHSPAAATANPTTPVRATARLALNPTATNGTSTAATTATTANRASHRCPTPTPPDASTPAATIPITAPLLRQPALL